MPAAARYTRPFKSNKPKEEPKILFQHFFKSADPQRTYVAQLKKLGNGNQCIVFTEGKRDPETGDVRKSRFFIYGEDFVEFFRLVKATSEFAKANPIPSEVAAKRAGYWKKVKAEKPKPAFATAS